MCRIIFYCAIGSLMMVSFSSCRKEVPKEEAEKMMKAMDNEIIRMANQIQGTRTYQAIQFLSGCSNVPLPYFSHHSTTEGGIRTFSFDQVKGKYIIDDKNRANFIAPSDSVIIVFNDPSFGEDEIDFVISEYTEEASSSSLMFPTRIYAWMQVGGRRLMTLDHFARLDHKLPVEVATNLALENFQMKAYMNTKLRKKYGNLTLYMEMIRDSNILSQLRTKARVGLVEPGAFYFKRLHMNYRMFPVRIDIRVKNEAISKDASRYVEEFNSNSKMFVYSQKNKGKLGEINLRTREGSDKLDYAFYYNDGSFFFLDDLLLSVREIMSVKK